MNTDITPEQSHYDDMSALFHSATEALARAEEAAIQAARAMTDDPRSVIACEIAQKTADGARVIWDEYRIAYSMAASDLSDALGIEQ